MDEPNLSRLPRCLVTGDSGCDGRDVAASMADVPGLCWRNPEGVLAAIAVLVGGAGQPLSAQVRRRRSAIGCVHNGYVADPANIQDAQADQEWAHHRRHRQPFRAAKRTPHGRLRCRQRSKSLTLNVSPAGGGGGRSRAASAQASANVTHFRARDSAVKHARGSRTSCWPAVRGIGLAVVGLGSAVRQLVRGGVPGVPARRRRPSNARVLASKLRVLAQTNVGFNCCYEWRGLRWLLFSVSFAPGVVRC